jgi:hypothetical protein
MASAAFRLAALLLCSSACGGSTSPAGPAEAAAGVNDPCAFVPRPEPPAELAAVVAEELGLANVGQLAIAEPEPARGARYSPAPRAATAFPGVRFAGVKALAYRYWDPLPASLALLYPGCDDQVLTDDGRLCPSAVVPAKPLSRQQVDALLELAARAPGQHRLRCGFNPHHAFVFTDAGDRPVADVRVCFECGEWSLNGEYQVSMPDGAYAQLAELCQRLGLGGCPLAAEPGRTESAAWTREEFWRWYEQGDPPRASSALGIAKDKALSAMTEVERRKLCAYRTSEVQRSALDAPDPSYDFGGGRTYRIQSFGECLERFPNCDLPLEALENAAFHLNRQGRLAKPEACIERWVFGPVGQCLWGISRGE